MAEPLINHFGIEIPQKIAAMIEKVYPEFDSAGFVKEVAKEFDELNLMQRGARIADVLQPFLPDDFPAAVDILVKSIGPKLEGTENHGMAPFLYLPHMNFIAKFGLDHFKESMQAQHTLTQRFTAEFSIRPFIEKYPEKTLARLREWTKDPSEHVRRLVSEGTRPRLPWASRLREFQRDPTPALALLELLKDDPSLYVRRSVANHLNDIGKDHPEVLVKTTRKWMKGASDERQWLIRHALRSAIKRGDRDALAVLGFVGDENIGIENLNITPAAPAIGKKVMIRFKVANEDSRQRSVMVDCQVHFVKANGSSSPKVFKLKAVEFGPQERVEIRKSISLAEMTTRKHYPGLHKIDVMLNGAIRPLGEFDLRK